MIKALNSVTDPDRTNPLQKLWDIMCCASDATNCPGAHKCPDWGENPTRHHPQTDQEQESPQAHRSSVSISWSVLCIVLCHTALSWRSSPRTPSYLFSRLLFSTTLPIILNGWPQYLHSSTFFSSSTFSLIYTHSPSYSWLSFTFSWISLTRLLQWERCVKVYCPLPDSDYWQ